MHTYATPVIVGPDDGKAGNLGSIGVRFMIDAEETPAGGFSLVEHPMGPRRLAAPLHRHTPRGRVLATCSTAAWARCSATTSSTPRPATSCYKPRNQWHTFWNAGDEPCSILEIIAPGGFERFFEELVDASLVGPPDLEWLSARSAHYGLEMDLASVPGLCERFGVTFG